MNVNGDGAMGLMGTNVKPTFVKHLVNPGAVPELNTWTGLPECQIQLCHLPASTHGQVT